MSLLLDPDDTSPTIRSTAVWVSPTVQPARPLRQQVTPPVQPSLRSRLRLALSLLRD